MTTTNPNRTMPTFAVYVNRVFMGHVQAITEVAAHKRAKALYGRCEVIPGFRKLAPKGRVLRADSSFTEGRSPCNNTAEGKAKIEAIRKAEIAKWMASQA